MNFGSWELGTAKSFFDFTNVNLLSLSFMLVAYTIAHAALHSLYYVPLHSTVSSEWTTCKSEDNGEQHRTSLFTTPTSFLHLTATTRLYEYNTTLWLIHGCHQGTSITWQHNVNAATPASQPIVFSTRLQLDPGVWYHLIALNAICFQCHACRVKAMSPMPYHTKRRKSDSGRQVHHQSADEDKQEAVTAKHASL